ncbi:MAG: hypothetical protein JNL60_05250 [Bacteroidia bacterium]|nr:hypothetical protein [Bacteroidia bacterium]
MVLFFVNNMQAQQTNPVQRKNAGRYQVELSACCNTLDFHLYNYNSRPVRGLPIKGYVDLFYPDGSQITVLLQQYEQSDLLSANVTYPGFRSLRVSFIIGEEKISVSFSVEHYHMVENKQTK